MPKKLKNSFPVCFLSHNEILFFHKGLFKTYDITNENTLNIIKLKLTLFENLLAHVPILSRIFRFGIRCGIKVSNDLVLFYKGSKIYELDLKLKSISSGFSTKDSSRPLAFTQIEKLKGFDDSVYFGGYLENPDRKPVSVFKRICTDHWDEVYRFPKGEIEHIHNIIPDPYKNLVYILTGDFNKSAGIWVTKNNFETVEPILSGDQIFRACTGVATLEGLLYATDSPFSKNSIRLLSYSNDKWDSMKICNINGPSIYGCQWNDDIVFSTSVESDGARYPTIWYKLFGFKRGSGIDENYCCIYKGNNEKGFKEIYRVKKDWFPFFLFQFGVLIFPSGLNCSSYLPIYHVATNRNNLTTSFIQENQLLT